MHLLPTLNRISKLTAFMESARATLTNTPGLVIVDRKDYMENQAAYIGLVSESFPISWKLKITNARGMGDKVREVWSMVRGCDWVSLLNDDHFFITPHWDTRLISQLNGKNIISCNDRYTCPPRIGGATIWSMPLLECVGWPIFPPQIDHLGIDDVWELLGRATGCWKIDNDVIVEHRQVMKGAPNDDTHKRTYGEGPWKDSVAAVDVNARMALWAELEFKQAVEKIKAFTKVDYFAKPQAERLAAP